MTSRFLVACFGARDPQRLAAFWAVLLDREVRPDDDGLLLPGAGGQLPLRFVPSDLEPEAPHRMHLHLTSDDLDHQQRTVERALSLGAQHLDVGQRPDEGHLVLADPDGYEFCVIEPRNAYLAGCGPLGEVACDGSRDVGVFWSEVLGWPLVWDQDGQTAVQSPDGGTKVAWGGPPVRPRTGRERQHLEVVADDLVSGEDPDGFPYRVRHGRP